ncbi:MAG: type VI secretion system tip protein VgrG [Myxococcales bacterium]|nr:type VI secretion system tip protein VgrG [Myxococcales bacterium]
MQHTQRGVAIDLSLEGLTGPVSVESLHGVERVSAPFVYRVQFHAAHVDLERARGAAARLELAEERGGERFVHGVVEEITVRPTPWADRHGYSVVIVPEAALLQYRHGFEIFQGLDVEQICTRVFERAGLDMGGFEWRLNASYPTRQMCVQYDETEWAFVSRLLEAEGIWYRFQHDAERTVMVFCDDSGSAPEAEPSPLSFDFRRSDVEAFHAHELEQTWSLVESRVELDDYDGFRPSRELRASATREGPSEREWFEYPGGYDDEAQGARLAEVRLAERAWPGRLTFFDTTALATTAGTRVSIAGAPVATDDGLVVANELTIRTPPDSPEPASDGTREVLNRLEVIAQDQPFRPARTTPRPRIAGPQTARVVGPADQEVWVDEHGRVKLQFHWDRRGQLDEQASHWVPVAHGHVTGAVMHPRIGWEVVVEFRHGDPDRPLVTGRVYNPFFPPPHALPERATVTAFGSDTLPGRELVNELRFEDRAGQEHVAVTAARDLREVTVLHRHVTVAHDESREVGVDRAEVVGVLRNVRVDERLSQSVGQAHDVVVGNDRHVLVVGNASEQIQQDLALDVTNFYFAQVGTGVPGTLFSALREPVDSPADALLDAVAALLEPARAAIEPEMSETGSSRELWSELPRATPVLGPVLGRMDEPPTPPEPAADATGSSPGESAGTGAEAVQVLGDVAEGALEVMDGLDTASEWLDGAWDGDLGDDLDPEALEGGSLPSFDAGALLEDIAPFVGKLVEVGASAAGANDQLRGVADAVAAIQAASRGARQLGADSSALALLDGATGLGNQSSTNAGASPLGGAPATNDGLSFVSGLLAPIASAWDGIQSVVGGDIHGTLVGIIAAANIAEAPEGQDPEPAWHRASWAHPYEREATHFAATVAAALLRGEVRDERWQNDEEEESSSDDTGGAESEEQATEEDDSGTEPNSEESEDDGQEPEPEEEPADEAENQPQGRGTWTVRVAGSTTEQIAGVAVWATATDMRIAVGGNATETTRMARFEQVGESRAEVVRGNKTESTGRYAVAAPEGIELHSDDTLRIAVDGDATSAAAGSRTLTAGQRVEVSGGNLHLNATDTITFECGAARVSVSSDGIAIEGTQITVRGDDIGVDSPALG